MPSKTYASLLTRLIGGNSCRGMSANASSQILQFHASERCLACREHDLKCMSERTDDRCTSCAAASCECQFERQIQVRGPRQLAEVYSVLAQDSLPSASLVPTNPLTLDAEMVSMDRVRAEDIESQLQSRSQSFNEAIYRTIERRNANGKFSVFNARMMPLSPSKFARTIPHPEITKAVRSRGACDDCRRRKVAV